MIDAVATWPHLVDHLAPVWCALPAEQRGTFWVSNRALVAHAHRRGVTATVGLPHHAGPPTLVANHHDLTQTHQARPVAYLEHGAGQTYQHDWPGHPSYSGGTDRQRVRLFLTLNAATAAREAAAYPGTPVVVVGSPHLDALAAVPRNPQRGVVAFAFHWDCHLVDETRETFSWWRHAIRRLAEHGHVVGHAHPRIAGTVARQCARWGIPFLDDLEDVIAVASTLAVDNSSVLYEAAALDIPVVALNHPRYRRDVHHGLRFWDQIPGPQADDRDTLPAVLDRARDAVWAARRRVVTAGVYPLSTRGRAAALAAAAVAQHLLG